MDEYIINKNEKELPERIGGHPSIEEYDYEQDKNLDTDYCRIRIFDNYFE